MEGAAAGGAGADAHGDGAQEPGWGAGPATDKQGRMESSRHAGRPGRF